MLISVDVTTAKKYFAQKSVMGHFYMGGGQEWLDGFCLSPFPPPRERERGAGWTPGYNQ